MPSCSRIFPLPALAWKRQGDDLIAAGFNDAAFDATYGGISELLGRSLPEVYGDIPEIVEDVIRAFAERSVVRREIPSYLFRTTGERRSMAFACSFVPPDLVIMHAEDITEYRQALQRLHLLERAVFSTSDGLGILYGLLTPDGNMPRLIFVNQAFSCLTGYRADEVVGQPVGFLKGASTDEEASEGIRRALATGRPFRTEIVIYRLIINAIEAMPEGGNLRISAQVAGEWVELTFADSGPGIAEEALPVLFEPFRTTKSGGVGLGLAVSRGILVVEDQETAERLSCARWNCAGMTLPARPAARRPWMCSPPKSTT